MGNKIRTYFSQEKEMQILVCGLGGAGKTTVLYKLSLEEVVTTTPTIGFSTPLLAQRILEGVERVRYKNVQFISLTIGSQEEIHRKYYMQTNALIFVIDSNDRERIEDCRDEMCRMIQEDELKDCPVLIMANKQDLPNAMSITELTDKLNLHTNLRNKQWHIQATTAVTGEGLYEGLDWLQGTLT